MSETRQGSWGIEEPHQVHDVIERQSSGRGVRLSGLTYGAKAIFDWLPTDKEREDMAVRGRYAGDYNTREAFQIALMWDITDEKRVRIALEMVEIAKRLSDKEGISLKTALWMLKEAQENDPTCRRVVSWKDWVRRDLARLRHALDVIVSHLA